MIGSGALLLGMHLSGALYQQVINDIGSGSFEFESKQNGAHPLQRFETYKVIATKLIWECTDGIIVLYSSAPITYGGKSQHI